MSSKIRKATLSDSQIILDFIQELAAYEQLAEHVVATTEDIHKTLFCDNPKAEVLILEVENNPTGFALFFHNYSTFLCKYGIYIEDIYVRAAYRGHGYGKALLKHICALAKERDCGRVEWWCLDWNKPSIDFYLQLGAEPMSDWTVYRLNKEQIEEMIYVNPPAA
jgi:GNAT superfamily N-acetyltransferase